MLIEYMKSAFLILKHVIYTIRFPLLKLITNQIEAKNMLIHLSNLLI